MHMYVAEPQVIEPQVIESTLVAPFNSIHDR